jgi:uncharacterized protein YndB with AHSA1/START domain
MEYGSIEREIHVDASPEVVFEVVSTPEHLEQWWPDEAVFEPVPGATGELVFGDRDAPGAHVPVLTVVDVDPPRRFSFWWSDDAEVAGEGNALFVAFDLEPAGEGTLVRMTETGFRERGWEAAVLEAAYLDHVNGWAHFMPRLPAYVERLVASR